MQNCLIGELSHINNNEFLHSGNHQGIIFSTVQPFIRFRIKTSVSGEYGQWVVGWYLIHTSTAINGLIW